MKAFILAALFLSGCSVSNRDSDLDLAKRYAATQGHDLNDYEVTEVKSNGHLFYSFKKKHDRFLGGDPLVEVKPDGSCRFVY